MAFSAPIFFVSHLEVGEIAQQQLLSKCPSAKQRRAIYTRLGLVESLYTMIRAGITAHCRKSYFKGSWKSFRSQSWSILNTEKYHQHKIWKGQGTRDNSWKLAIDINSLCSTQCYALYWNYIKLHHPYQIKNKFKLKFWDVKGHQSCWLSLSHQHKWCIIYCLKHCW